MMEPKYKIKDHVYVPQIETYGVIQEMFLHRGVWHYQMSVDWYHEKNDDSVLLHCVDWETGAPEDYILPAHRVPYATCEY